jgi:hypothetical protein
MRGRDRDAARLLFRRLVDLVIGQTSLEEVVARMSDLTMARASYDLAVVRWPLKLVMLCQGGRILRRSDRARE